VPNSFFEKDAWNALSAAGALAKKADLKNIFSNGLKRFIFIYIVIKPR